MPIYADFNRDGRISQNASELLAGQRPPGAVVIPNFDADSAYAGSSGLRQGIVPLDSDLRMVGPSENELTEIQVICAPGATAGLLSIRESDLRLVRVYDAGGSLVIGEGSGNIDAFSHSFPCFAVAERFFIEAIRLPGYPDSADYPIFGRVQISLTSLDAHATPIGATERVFVTLSPFLLMHNSNQALVMYMCESVDNEPSRRDVFDAFGIPWQSGLSSSERRLRGNRIPCTLVTVPLTAHMRDIWIQDQFEVGYFRGAGRDLPCILHLPRLRRNFTLLREGQNLGAWTALFFSGQDKALIQHLWQPQLKVINAAGNTLMISHEAAAEIEFLIAKLRETYTFLRRLENDAHLQVELLQGEDRSVLFADSGVMLWALSVRADQQINASGNRQSGEDETAFNQHVQALQSALRQRWDVIRTEFELQPTPIPASGPAFIVVRTNSAGPLRFVALTEGEVVTAGQTQATAIDFTDEGADSGPARDINELERRIQRLVGSHNYGGNIEVAPPSPGNRFGQVFVGSPEEGNPRLWRFLANQGYQPVVEASTNWLLVGHLDEILSFAPVTRSGNAGTPFIAFRASADLALSILLAARDLHLQGLPANPDDLVFNDETDRPLNYRHLRTDEGTHPITRMLRGKRWKLKGSIQPPMIYQVLLHMLNVRMGSRRAARIDYSRELSTYDAAIGIREALHLGHDFNREIEADYLAARSNEDFVREEILDSEEEALNNPPQPLHEVLENNLMGVPIVRLPVFFDLPIYAGKTIAFLPNVVNMQHVEDHALVPRPYGPRMKPDDAAQILSGALPSSLQALANRSYFIRNRLNRVWHWASPTPGLAISDDDLNHIVRIFRDGFPLDMEDNEIARRIRIHPLNRGAFRRESVRIGENTIVRWLLNGDHRRILIPENTIDLFEAYTYIVLKEMCGLRVRFVDSWSYHLDLGEIHCGTNVVRRPTRSPDWWDVRQRVPDD